ncbi:hypothetical protein [Hymenobacter sp. IS2118]|uniref:hypothetical protein n=1 Tax=Hymenobacter sp. IS2118 TaxID=1505605 RepID=UPI000A93E09C|nr:hypothetical protein [Hymenobacter sp. IS2118]
MHHFHTLGTHREALYQNERQRSILQRSAAFPNGCIRVVGLLNSTPVRKPDALTPRPATRFV